MTTPQQQFPNPEAVMHRAIELARQGIGYVEPNPPVGAVIVDANLQLIAEGYHQRFGSDHAEINAFSKSRAIPDGAMLFVTLEPCCHHGKTPPCTDVILNSGIQTVYVAVRDPAPHVDGGGIRKLEEHGVSVHVGLLAGDAAELAAPFLKRMQTGLPYVHAKWAMTLDGKIAAASGHSQWISNAKSRERVHELRGRMDAIVVGIETALTDDPLLTARPPGPGTAARIVFDSQARLPIDSQLVQTLDAAPVIVAVGNTAAVESRRNLEEAGVELIICPETKQADARYVMEELGRQEFSNILIEGGGALLGTFFDDGLIDEVHVFIGSKIVGGKASLSPIGGIGLDAIPNAGQLRYLESQTIDDDIYVRAKFVSDEPQG